MGKVRREVRSQAGKGGESGEVAIKWERWGREVRWQGGKGGERGEVSRWERWGREVKRQGGRFLVLFKGRGRGVSPRFQFLFLMLINRRKGQDGFWIFLRGRRVGKTLLKSKASR